MTRYTATQQAIRRGLLAGERVIGPVTVRKPWSSKPITRQWGWESGGAVEANAVNALVSRKVLEIRPLPGARFEAVLKED